MNKIISSYILITSIYGTSRLMKKIDNTKKIDYANYLSYNRDILNIEKVLIYSSNIIVSPFIFPYNFYKDILNYEKKYKNLYSNEKEKKIITYLFELLY